MIKEMIKYFLTWALGLFGDKAPVVDAQPVEAPAKKKPTVKKATTRAKKPAVAAKTARAKKDK